MENLSLDPRAIGSVISPPIQQAIIVLWYPTFARLSSLEFKPDLGVDFPYYLIPSGGQESEKLVAYLHWGRCRAVCYQFVSPDKEPTCVSP